MLPAALPPPEQHASRDASSVDVPQPFNKIGDGPRNKERRGGKGKKGKGKNKGKNGDQPEPEPGTPETVLESDSDELPGFDQRRFPEGTATSSSRTPPPRGSAATGSTAVPKSEPAPGVSTNPEQVISTGSAMQARMLRTKPFVYLGLPVKTVAEGKKITTQGIRKAYLEMSRKLHPDKAGNSVEAQENSVFLTRIYELLNKPNMLEASARRWLEPDAKAKAMPGITLVQGALAQVFGHRVVIASSSGQEFDTQARRCAAAMAEQAAEAEAARTVSKGGPVAFGPKAPRDPCEACREKLPRKNKGHTLIFRSCIWAKVDARLTENVKRKEQRATPESRTKARFEAHLYIVKQN